MIFDFNVLKSIIEDKSSVQLLVLGTIICLINFAFRYEHPKP